MNDYTDNSPESSAKPGIEEQAQSLQGKQAPALIEKFVIRLPKGLRNKIKHLSEQNRRSMNSEIIMVLEKHIQQNLMDQVADFDSMADQPVEQESLGSHEASVSELTRRLENLPEEKKQALLELLG